MKAFLAIFAALALAGPVAAVELVTNGGFETGNLTGWTGPTGTGGFAEVTVSGPFEGSFTYWSAGSSFKTISQTLATTPGQTYAYSFRLSNGDTGPNALVATLGSSSLAALTNAGAFGFTLFSGTHVAVSANETLSFSARNQFAIWRIDAVSVTTVPDVSVVPEPATWAMLVTGFGLAGATLRRRRMAATA